MKRRPPHSQTKQVPRAIAPRESGEAQNIEGLVRNDREQLSSFVKNLNSGVALDDMDDDLKAWWTSRY